MPSHQTSQPRPQAPSGRALPVVLDEADVVQLRVDADGVERAEVEVLEVGRRRLEDDLELVVVLPAVRVLAVAAVGRAARRLDVGGVPRLGAERAQRRRRVEGAGADLHVVGLQDHAALLGPVGLQRRMMSWKLRGRSSGDAGAVGFGSRLGGFLLHGSARGFVVVAARTIRNRPCGSRRIVAKRDGARARNTALSLSKGGSETPSGRVVRQAHHEGRRAISADGDLKPAPVHAL